MNLEKLPASTIRALAKTLAAESTRLEREAEARDRAARTQREQARHRSIAYEVHRLTRGRRGLDHAAAIEAVARAHKLPSEAVAGIVRRARSEERDWQLLHLYERGLPDAEIAGRIGMHPKSVNRAIARARRRIGTL